MQSNCLAQWQCQTEERLSWWCQRAGCLCDSCWSILLSSVNERAAKAGGGGGQQATVMWKTPVHLQWGTSICCDDFPVFQAQIAVALWCYIFCSGVCSCSAEWVPLCLCVCECGSLWQPTTVQSCILPQRRQVGSKYTVCTVLEQRDSRPESDSVNSLELSLSHLKCYEDETSGMYFFHSFIHSSLCFKGLTKTNRAA